MPEKEEVIDEARKLIKDGAKVSTELLEIGFNTPADKLIELTNVSSREALSMAITGAINTQRKFTADLATHSKWKRQSWLYNSYDKRLEIYEKMKKEYDKWKKQKPKEEAEPVLPVRPRGIIIKKELWATYKQEMIEYRKAMSEYALYEEKVWLWEKGEPHLIEHPGTKPEEPGEETDRPEMFFLSDHFITLLQRYKRSVDGMSLKALYEMGKIGLEVSVEEQDQTEPLDI